MNNLREAFTLVADGHGHGVVAALGQLTTGEQQRYALIWVPALRDYIHVTYRSQAPVTVSEALRVGEKCLLRITDNAHAVWLSDYSDTSLSRHQDTDVARKIPNKQVKDAPTPLANPKEWNKNSRYKNNGRRDVPRNGNSGVPAKVVQAHTSAPVQQRTTEGVVPSNVSTSISTYQEKP